MDYYYLTEDGYLMHYGIEGQKWGKRNGPPYPLDASQASASEKRAGFRSARDEKRAARKEARQKKKYERNLKWDKIDWEYDVKDTSKQIQTYNKATHVFNSKLDSLNSKYEKIDDSNEKEYLKEADKLWRSIYMEKINEDFGTLKRTKEKVEIGEEFAKQVFLFYNMYEGMIDDLG